ncbi:MAG: Na+-dependent transporter [Acidobacteria bacterium]|nr:Na+-dependent transporter [Acidobacteriota bacterium]
MPALAEIVKYALTANIFLLVVQLGTRASFDEATSFFRNLFRPPASLFRAVLAMNFVVPLAAAALALTFNIHPAVKIALVAMSISPVPPLVPGKQLRFGGRASYVYGLLVAVSLVAIFTVPLSVELLGRLFGRDAHMNFFEISWLLARTVLLPLSIGMALRAFAPKRIARASERIARVCNSLLIVGLAPIFWKAAPDMWSLVGNGTVLSIAALAFAAMAAGHWIGGPNEQDRTALGIFAAVRHPGVALAIAKDNWPADRLIPAAILLFSLVTFATTTLYGRYRLKRYSVPESLTSVPPPPR